MDHTFPISVPVVEVSALVAVHPGFVAGLALRMAILLANIVFEQDVAHTLGGLGEAIHSLQDIVVFAGRAVVGEAAASAACRALVEDVEGAANGDGIVVESLPIHFDGLDCFPKEEAEFKVEGPIDLAEDVGCFLVSSVG